VKVNFVIAAAKLPRCSTSSIRPYCSSIAHWRIRSPSLRSVPKIRTYVCVDENLVRLAFWKLDRRLSAAWRRSAVRGAIRSHASRAPVHDGAPEGSHGLQPDVANLHRQFSYVFPRTRPQFICSCTYGARCRSFALIMTAAGATNIILPRFDARR